MRVRAWVVFAAVLEVLTATTAPAPATGWARPSAPDGRGAQHVVWVALEDAGEVAQVNVATGRVLRRVVTPGGPHNITVAGDGTVVVALWASDRIAIVRNARLLVTLGGAPHDVKVSGQLIAVANQGAARIDRVWLSGDPLAPISLRADPHDLAITPNGRRAWVSLEGSDDLAVVGLCDRSVRYVSTGRSPHDLLFAPDGRLWVTDWNGALHVFDGPTRVKSLQFGEEAHHLAFTPDGEEGWITDHGARRIFILSVRPVRRIDTLRFPGEPHHVAITANGRWAVVADHANARLVVYDARSHRRVRTIRVGAGPHGVWAVPTSA